MREMKNSGIEWIGRIPANWITLPTKSIFKVLSGATPQSGIDDFFGDDIPWITPADYKTEDKYIYLGKRSLTAKGFDSCSASLVPKGSIIFSKRAPIGSVAISANDLSTNQGCLSCVPKRKMVIEYFYYLMSICTEQYELLGSGTTFKEISALNYANFTLIWPPITEQEEIVAYLDVKCSYIDTLISNVQSQIEKLKAYKQSMITEVVTKGLNPSVPMKESGLEWVGKVPASWNTIQLKYCTYIRARLGWKGLKAEEYEESGYPLLSAFNIQNSKLDFSNVNYINQFRYDESPEIKLTNDDILLVKDGAGIGKCAIVENLPMESTTNGSLAVITITDSLYPKFLYYYFLSAYFQQFIDRIKGGMGVPHLFQSDLREIRVIIPGKEEQKDSVDYLDEKCAQIDQLIAIKQKKIEKLNQYKKSLIYEYVTVKKEV